MDAAAADRGSLREAPKRAQTQHHNRQLSHWKFQCTIRVRRRKKTNREQSTTALQTIASSVSNPPWLTAVRAAESKKAVDIRVLDLRDVTTFADFFVVCTGSNPKQIQAIAEEIGTQLEQRGERPVSVEGFENAEWVLADYGDYLIHVFSPKAREYYDLERLWRSAKTIDIPAA